MQGFKGRQLSLAVVSKEQEKLIGELSDTV